ncbi:MAG: radical SAM protein [Deltaproteobacteria bacterium]|nr:radical SAM protein [Deltaproteobacteria bacterium]
MELYKPSEILIERGEEDAPVVQRTLARLPEVPVRIVDKGWERGGTESNGTDSFAAGKRRLLFTRQHSTFLEHCPAGTPGLVCCNYLVVSLISNCPMDCSYCFLQEYLANNPTLKVFTNVADLLHEVAAVVDRQPWRQFRIGTGELSDSLALDALLGFSADLVPFFAERKNALLELKTKSDCVAGLLTLDPKDRVVVSWSLTPPEIVEREEHGTAAFCARLEAARRVQMAGYKLGFHFDPLIEYPGWEEGYRDTVARVFSTIDPRRVAWVSLGSLRLTPALRVTMRRRFPQTRLLSGEQVPCADGKWRTFQALRVKMYRALAGWLREAAPQVPLYMCMETAPVWEKVFGRAPTCDKEVARALVAPNLANHEKSGSPSTDSA